MSEESTTPQPGSIRVSEPWDSLRLETPIRWGPDGVHELTALELRAPRADDMWDFVIGHYEIRDLLRVGHALAGGDKSVPWADLAREISYEDSQRLFGIVRDRVIEPWTVGEPVPIKLPYEHELREPIPQTVGEPITKIRIERIAGNAMFAFPVGSTRTFGDFLGLIGRCAKWPEARTRSLRNVDAAHLCLVAMELVRPFLR